ncbi:hypothetical protein Pfo_014831 [Paulownia fortunei]|nr:hypothetical protein Pfo_014831 [Paulownia fortunei]
MLGAEAGHVSQPKKKKAIVVKSKNVMSEAQTEEPTTECDPCCQYCSNSDNANTEEDKGDGIYEESDEDPEDVEPEEDPEVEIYEESDEDPEDVIDEEPEEDPEAEIDGETEEDPEEEIVEDPEEDSEEEINEESDEEGLAAENSHLSSAMSGGIDSKGLGNELNDDPQEERGKKVIEESWSGPISKSVTPTISCHNNICRPIEDQNQYLQENPVIRLPSMSNACKAGYALENASKIGSQALEAYVTAAVRESDGENGLSKVIVNGECASKQQEHGGSSGKHRQSRWDLKQEGETPQIDGTSKRRKTRWDNNDSQNGLFNPSAFINSLELSIDPKIISLRVKLMEINKKLQSSEIYDERPAGERSPSPEPVYNNLGIRINTRDARIRKKLMNERKHIISKLAKTNLTFKSSKHKPNKFVKKLFVPEKEYPKYSFIGLILGPKGNSQKKMEKETGAKILLRGKGSGEPDPSGDEDLHVQVEADNQQALDAAVAMIEKLLIPVADRNNDHKRAQLAELAKLRGDNNVCDLCKEQGHKTYACPLQDSTFKAVCCDICGSFGHSTSNCSVSRSPLICKTLQVSSGVVFGSKDKSNKEVDHAGLYVGYLSHAIDEKRLKELFLPFGKIISTTVVKDQTTGLSKGYGFVKFENPSDAAAAVTYMNGYKMDDKMLAVRVAGKRPVPGPLHSGHVPIHSSHAAVPSNILGQTSCIYGPAISMLPEAPFSTPNNVSLSFPPSSSYSGHNINVARTEAINIHPYVVTDPRVTSNVFSGYNFCVQVPSSLPNSVSQFPGHPDYPVPGSSHTSPVH